MKTNKEIGRVGEHIAALFLQKKGYKILKRNYSQKYAEIDIIASKDNIVSFVEVKSLQVVNPSVSREILRYDPSEKVDHKKLQKIKKAGENYLNEMNEVCEGRVIVIEVYIHERLKKARCRIIENVL